MSMIGILICLSWDWIVWTFFRRIWSLSDTTFGRFGVVPHCLSCFACVASDCFWVAFFSFSYLCLLLWPFCVHMVFSSKLLSWTDTRPVDDKYNVEKSRCALLKNTRPQMLQEWTSEVLASGPGMREAELQASNPSKFFKEASWEGYPTRPGEPGQGKGIPESWLSEATTS